jgi:hypothetical protein
MNSASIRPDPKIDNKTETGKDASFTDAPAPGKALERKRRS